MIMKIFMQNLRLRFPSYVKLLLILKQNWNYPLVIYGFTFLFTKNKLFEINIPSSNHVQVLICIYLADLHPEQ